MIFTAFVTRARKYTTFLPLIYIGLKRHRTKTTWRSDLSPPIYTDCKFDTMLLVLVELLWHETGRRGKVNLQGEILQRDIQASILAALKC